MTEELEALVGGQFPQLRDIAFLDYDKEWPVPLVSIETTKSLGNKLLPSPHSSEEQSDFDRTLMLLRKAAADLCSVSLANFDVIVFGTAEAALDAIFESFGWTPGSKYIIDDTYLQLFATAKPTL